MSCPLARLARVSAAYLMVATCVIVASPSRSVAGSWACPGYPVVCQESCSLDGYGTPIYCEGGLCVCAAGYDTVPGPPVSCVPLQPQLMPSSADGEYGCSDSCTSMPWASPMTGPWNPFDLVAVHGTSPGGEAFMPVWGAQANNPFCGVHGMPAKDIKGNPIRTWAVCPPDPYCFCRAIQNSDEGEFNPTSCDNSEGCGDNTGPQDALCTLEGWNFACTSQFTSAHPFLDTPPNTCEIVNFRKFLDPSRIDFANNAVVYRAPIIWENHSDEGLDDDYTMNLHSPGHELYDTNGEFLYNLEYGRVHVEFDADETIDHFIPNFDSDKCYNPPGSTTPNPPAADSFGLANLWWRKLRCLVDQSPAGDDDQADRDIRCFMKSLVTPTLACPQPDGVNPEELTDPNTGLPYPDPMAVVVGVPGLDCVDDPEAGTDEIHPAYAVAIRIQQDPSQPEQWAFFYRRHGDNGGCGSKVFGRCGTTFKLPLGLPVVPAASGIKPPPVLTSADVHVDWHAWTEDDSSPSGVAVASSFDLLKGTVLTITLPDLKDGVVGLVSVTPAFDTAPPLITCPTNITTPVDLGKCTAAVTFTPTVSDNCSVSAVCSPPSGTEFPIGTATDTCTATDQAGLQASCSFSITTTAGNQCPLAQGYWKNHPGAWPVGSLTLGSVTYNTTQLVGILNSSSTRDASLILAKPLIAALLNLANGSNPVPVCNTIGDADSLLDGCTVGCSTGAKSSTGQAMISDADSLDLYNNGKLTAGCTP